VYVAEAKPFSHWRASEAELRLYRLSPLEDMFYRMACPLEVVLSPSACGVPGVSVPHTAFKRVCDQFQKRYPKLVFKIIYDREYPHELTLVAESTRARYVLARTGLVYEYRPFDALVHSVMSSRCDDFSWGHLPFFTRMTLLHLVVAVSGYIRLDRREVSYCTTVLHSGKYCYRLPNRFEVVSNSCKHHISICPTCRAIVAYKP
jgi:hypothetical protein